MLLAVLVFSGYTFVQLQKLTALQAGIIDRNRADSLLLLRIQNSLNALGTAMRDMLEPGETYPLTAWRSQFERLRTDLEDALRRQAEVAPRSRTGDQDRYLATSMKQFWDALDQVFALAATDEAEARLRVRLSLQARHEALTSTVSRLLVQNHDHEQRAAAEAQAVYRRVERNLYVFLTAMLGVIAITSLQLVRYNRRVFRELNDLAEQRRELARQLISAQESTLRSLSRELHDEFGQTLTAVGMALQRAHRTLDSSFAKLRAELQEVHTAVQTMLDRMRHLSHSLHPVVLEGMGLVGAMEAHIPRFESRTGIAVRFLRPPRELNVPRDTAIHVYRVFQEALSNAARHSGATLVEVRLSADTTTLRLEIEDDGTGFRQPQGSGMGVVSMRERAGIAGGSIEYLEGQRGGALVRLAVPVPQEVASAPASS